MCAYVCECVYIYIYIYASNFMHMQVILIYCKWTVNAHVLQDYQKSGKWRFVLLFGLMSTMKAKNPEN